MLQGLGSTRDMPWALRAPDLDPMGPEHAWPCMHTTAKPEMLLLNGFCPSAGGWRSSLQMWA